MQTLLGLMPIPAGLPLRTAWSPACPWTVRPQNSAFDDTHQTGWNALKKSLWKMGSVICLLLIHSIIHFLFSFLSINNFLFPLVILPELSTHLPGTYQSRLKRCNFHLVFPPRRSHLVVLNCFFPESLTQSQLVQRFILLSNVDLQLVLLMGRGKGGLSK